jgi:hypothetical protein
VGHQKTFYHLGNVELFRCSSNKFLVDNLRERYETHKRAKIPEPPGFNVWRRVMHGYPIRRLPVPVPETADHGAGTGREMRARRGRLCPHFERIKPAIYIDPVQLNTNKLLYGLCQTIDVFCRFIFATI